MWTKAFRWAGRGVLLAYRSERNFRIHLALAELAIFLWFSEGLPAMDLAVLWLTIALVLSLELANTAVERAVDLSTRGRQQPLAAAAKDAAAGAVLLAAAGAAAVGAVLLGPHLGRVLSLLRSSADRWAAAALVLGWVLTFWRLPPGVRRP